MNLIKTRPSSEKSTHTRVKQFSTEFIDNDNWTLAISPFDVAYAAEQDVVDLAAFFRRDGEIYLALNDSARPATAIRSHIAPLRAGDGAPTGRVVELPAGYLQVTTGEANFVQTIERLLEDKVGSEAIGSLNRLGGTYFPSVGGSTELVFPHSVEVKPRTNFATNGQGFDHERITVFMPLQEVVDNYLNGGIEDMRAPLAAFRLAREHGISLTTDIELPKSETTIPNLGTKPALRNAIRTTAEREGITHIRVTEDENPGSSFLEAKRFYAQNTPEGEEYPVDVFLRSGVDSVDIGAYAWSNGKLYMAVKQGVRPAIAARNTEQHPIHTETSPLFIEGPAGSLQGEITMEELESLVEAELSEEFHLGARNKPVFVAADYPSAGNSPERTYRFLVEADPNSETDGVGTIDETLQTWFVEVNDLLELADEGYVRDPRLALNAHILAASFNYEEKQPKKSLVKNSFVHLIQDGSKVQEWLGKTAHEVDKKLHQSVIYRRIKVFNENELGLTINPFTHEDEQSFFSNGFPLYQSPQPDVKKQPFYLAHDMRHYSGGDFVPFRIAEDGSLEPLDFETYRLAGANSECLAVHYSDVLIPKLFGLDRAEEIFGGKSVARTMDELGLSDEESKALIFQIERDGHIPDEILTHDAYEANRDVLVGRLLRYNVMDTRHLGIMYSDWAGKENLARAALQFGLGKAVFNDLDAFNSHLDSSLEEALNYSEGVNPLKALVARTMNYELRLNAMKIGYALDLATGNDSQALNDHLRLAHQHIGNLQLAYDELAAIHANIQDVEPNAENLDAFKTVSAIREHAVIPAEEYLRSFYAQPELLTEAQREHDRGRIVPFIKNLAVLDMDDVHKTALEIENQNRARVDLPPMDSY